MRWPAPTRSSRGRVAEGEKLMRDALEGHTRVVGASNPATMGTMTLLMEALWNSHRVEDAIAVSSHRVELSRSSEDPLSPGPTPSVHGAILLDAGRYDEARHALNDAYTMIETTFGSVHPQTRAAAERLASYYAKAHEREPASGTTNKRLVGETLQRWRIREIAAR